MAVVLRSDGVPAVVVDADVASAPSGAGGATGGRAVVPLVGVPVALAVPIIIVVVPVRRVAIVATQVAHLAVLVAAAAAAVAAEFARRRRRRGRPVVLQFDVGAARRSRAPQRVVRRCCDEKNNNKETNVIGFPRLSFCAAHSQESLTETIRPFSF